MYIVYGGLSSKYEHFKYKYASVQIESFVFQKPPQNHILNVMHNKLLNTSTEI